MRNVLPDDNIDEVALNVLLAEGVDLPTALEARRRSADDEVPAASYGCFIVAAIVAVILLALRLFARVSRGSCGRNRGNL